MWPFRKKQAPPAKIVEPPPPAKPTPSYGKISFDHLAMSKRRHGDQQTLDMLLQPPPAPPYARGNQLALDEQIQWAATPQLGTTLAFYNPYLAGWMNFALLAQLAEIPEFYLISEAYAEHATRKGFELISNTEKDLSKQIEELQEELDRLHINEVLHDVVLFDGLFGRAHTFLDFGVKDPDELLFDIGDGSDKSLVSKAKIKEGSLDCITVCDPFWVYPQAYEATHPIRSDFYVPETWLASGDMVHRSRLLPWISHPVPFIMRPAWQFSGLSRTQMSFATVMEYRRNRDAVAKMLDGFNVRVLATDLSASLGVGGDEIFKRAQFLSNYVDNQGVLLLNKDTEEFSQIAAPLAGLSDLAAQAAERLCMTAKIPMAFLFGTTAKGLNATSEPEIEIWNNHIHSFQEKFLTPNLMRLVRFAQLNIWGRVNDNINIRWVELAEMSEKDRGEHNAKLAETDRTLVDLGAISAREVRERVASDEASGYNNLNVDEMPEPPMQEEDEFGMQGARANGQGNSEFQKEANT